MRYVIVDLEATCWDTSGDRSQMEIIEIGAVLLDSETGPPIQEFAEFVRPVVVPILSEFCKQLTSIKQAQVDAADGFSTVFARFVDWIGPAPFTLCSWGGYDLNQFRQDCRRHQVALPATFERHINLKKEFARLMHVRLCGMSKALRILQIPLVGTHHRGIDDARNIAKLAQVILPKLYAETSRE
jgi:3'-5' exoribonuclease 1